MNRFIALPLPETLRAELGALPRPPVAATWARAEGLHLTLAFLGALPDDRVEGVAAVMAACAEAHPSFPLRTAALSGFPALRRTRVLWLGVDPDPRLDALAAELRARLEAAGLPFDPKPFVPHLTLARLKVPSDLRGLASPPPRDFPADRLVLYASRRDPDGARYEEVRSVPLGG